MPSFRVKLFGNRSRSAAREQPSPPNIQRKDSWTAPMRRSTADSLSSLNEHLRLLRLGSARSSDDRDAHPPTYAEATAGQDPGTLPSAAAKKAKNPESSLLRLESPSHSDLIDPVVDEARAEEQLLKAATSFLPPPPSHAQPLTSTSTSYVPELDEHDGGIELEKHPLPEPLTTFPRLSHPVLIPRVAPGPTMPFMRALPPSLLESHGITESTFLTFVDHLNILCTPHAAIQAVQIASVALDAVPLDYADGLSALLQLLCIVTSHVIIQKRCTLYLDRVNEAFFAPRGLHARIVGTKEVRRVLGLPKDDKIYVPLSQETIDLTCQERCMAGLEARGAARLETDGLAVPSKEAALLARLAAWQVRSKLCEFEKAAKRARKRALKKMEKGKKVKGEGSSERLRIKWLGWILVEDLADWQQVVEEKEKAKAEKELKKWGKRVKKGGSAAGPCEKGIRDEEEEVRSQTVLDTVAKDVKMHSTTAPQEE